MAISSVSLYHHYGTSKSSFCDFGGNFNCDMVNRSIYSEVLGIPVALIGVLGYGGLLVLAALPRKREGPPLTLLAASTTGSAFALYLTYVEALVLGVWCVLCLSSMTLILLITFLAAMLTVNLRARN